MPDVMQGAQATVENLRQQKLDNGDYVITAAFERLMDGVPPIFQLRVLWALDPEHKRKSERLNDLWQAYAAAINAETDEAAMQQLFNQFVVDVGGIAAPLTPLQPPQQPPVDQAAVGIPADEFDVMTHQELVDYLIKFVYFGNEGMRGVLSQMDISALKTTAREARTA